MFWSFQNDHLYQFYFFFQIVLYYFFHNKRKLNNEVLKLNRKHNIKLVAPFVKMSKAEEIIIGDNLKVDFSNTHTCYNGVDEFGRSCGKCPTCTERLNNFAKVGIKDPIKYIE